MGIKESCADKKIDPQQIKIDFQDNAGNARQAVSIAQRHLSQGVQAYISGVSPMSLAVAPQVSESKMPHLLVAFDANICKGHPERMRILPHYKIEGPVYVDFARFKKAKRVFGIVHNNSAYIDEFAQIVEPGLKASGIAFQKELFEFDHKDFRSIALKAKEFKPDLIFVAGFSTHIVPTIEALKANGMVHDQNVLVTLDFIDLLYTNAPSDVLSDVPFIAPAFELPGISKMAQGWKGRYEKEFGNKPNYVEAYAYDTGTLMVDAFAKEKKMTIESLKAALPKEGVTGTIKLDADGDLAVPLHTAIVNKEGEVSKIH